MFPIDTKILVVDDAQTIVAQMKMFLGEIGYTSIISAKNLAEATSQLEESIKSNSPVGLVLCDVNMPGGSGLDFLKHVRRHPSASATPFIIVTSEAEKSTITEAIAGGVTGYLLKPFSKAILQKKLAETWEGLQQ